MHIKHITFRVKDIEKSIEFYQGLAELTVSRRFSAGQAKLAFLTNGQGETEIEFIHIPDSPTVEAKGMFICFETDKLDEVHATAMAKNLNPSDIQCPDDGSRYFYVYDPDGVSVQLRAW